MTAGYSSFIRSWVWRKSTSNHIKNIEIMRKTNKVKPCTLIWALFVSTRCEAVEVDWAVWRSYFIECAPVAELKLASCLQISALCLANTNSAAESGNRLSVSPLTLREDHWSGIHNPCQLYGEMFFLFFKNVHNVEIWCSFLYSVFSLSCFVLLA